MAPFFPFLAAVLLGGILVGFARTFFLRGFFDVPPIPMYLYGHGAVLTSWFVLVFVQASLVSARRLDVHRRLGVAGAVIAALVVLISPLVVVRSMPRFEALGISPAHLQGIVIGDFQSLIVFVALVAAALHFRHRPASHKRLMLLSCFAIYGPVHSRLEQLGFHLSWELLLGGFLLSLVMYDLVSAGRVHRATTWGGLLVLAGDLVGLALVGTAAGGSIVDSLR